MVEFVGNWGERPESETVRWKFPTRKEKQKEMIKLENVVLGVFIE